MDGLRPLKEDLGSHPEGMLIELKPEHGKNQPKVMSFNFSVEFLHCLIVMKINKTNRFFHTNF